MSADHQESGFPRGCRGMCAVDCAFLLARLWCCLWEMWAAAFGLCACCVSLGMDVLTKRVSDEEVVAPACCGWACTGAAGRQSHPQLSAGEQASVCGRVARSTPVEEDSRSVHEPLIFVAVVKLNPDCAHASVTASRARVCPDPECSRRGAADDCQLLCQPQVRAASAARCLVHV